MYLLITYENKCINALKSERNIKRLYRVNKMTTYSGLAMECLHGHFSYATDIIVWSASQLALSDLI